MAIGATVSLLLVSDGSPRAIVSLTIFGLASVLLFSASTLLHAVRAGPVLERWLRRLDHAAIFVLIAGSYTPIALLAMQPRFAGWGWTLFGVVWGIALAGLVFKLLWINAPRWLSTALYLAMGWLVVIAIVPVAKSLGVTNMTWLGVGGAFYTVGAVIYGTKRPNPWPGVVGFHELWHLFVLAGWACHLVMVFRVAQASA
jgi:hemolysin III